MLPHAFHKRARPRAYERERRTPTPARINARARTRAGDCAGDADLLLALRDAAVRHNRWQPGPQPAETAARCPFSLLLRRTPGRAADGRPLGRRRGGGVISAAKGWYLWWQAAPTWWRGWCTGSRATPSASSPPPASCPRRARACSPSRPAASPQRPQRGRRSGRL